MAAGFPGPYPAGARLPGRRWDPARGNVGARCLGDRRHHPPGAATPQPGLCGRCDGRRPGGEGQTGEAGTGLGSPLVNKAGPCNLYKALNGRWEPLLP